MVERSGQGMNLMFELSVQEAKALPDFAGTDEFFVSVTLNGLILDKEMLSVIRRISEKDSEILSTEDFLTINALYHGQTLDRKMQDRLSRLTDMGIAEQGLCRAAFCRWHRMAPASGEQRRPYEKGGQNHFKRQYRHCF
jgi:ATP-dependent DNA helicase RecG